MTGSSAAPIDLTGIDNGRVNLTQYPPVGSVSVGGMSADVIASFADLGYNFTGKDTKSMIVEFQLDNKIIASRDDESAGVYGPKTRATLATLHGVYLARRKIELDLIESAKQKLLAEHNIYRIEYSDAQSQVANFGQPKLKQVGDHISKLQKFLAT